MSKPSPTEILKAMLAAAQEAESVEDMAEVGTYARQYAEHAKGDLDANNVEAFLDGCAIINLLVQESILRVTTTADEIEPVDDRQALYNEGVKDGAMMIARLMGGIVDTIIAETVEDARYDRAFLNIVNNI